MNSELKTSAPVTAMFPKLVLAALFMVVLAACTATSQAPPAELHLADEPLHGKFVWHDLITDDTDAARRFYGGLFGWTFENSTREGKPYLVVKHGAVFLAGMLEVEDPEDGSDYSRWLGYMSVANVDRVAAESSVAGGQQLVEPRDVSGIARVAVVQDPQGAVLGLIRSRVGDPDDSVTVKAGSIVWNEMIAANDQVAAEFYQAIAGVEVDVLQRRGGKYIKLVADGIDRAGILQRPNDDIEPLWLTYFAVVDPVAAANKAASLGGKILLAPSADFREGTLALIEDPTGAVLALQKLEQ